MVHPALHPSPPKHWAEMSFFFETKGSKGCVFKAELRLRLLWGACPYSEVSRAQQPHVAHYTAHTAQQRPWGSAGEGHPGAPRAAGPLPTRGLVEAGSAL